MSLTDIALGACDTAISNTADAVQDIANLVTSGSTMLEGDRANPKTKGSEPEENKKGDLQTSNRFSESKNFIQSIADVSLMMANISQLRAILGSSDKNQFYIPLLALVILSLVSHVIFVIFTVIRSHCKYKHRITVKRAKADMIKDVATEEKGQKRCCSCFTKKYNRDEYNDSDLCQCPHCYADLYLNYFCNILVFITICANIGITGIGITGDC